MYPDYSWRSTGLAVFHVPFVGRSFPVFTLDASFANYLNDQEQNLSSVCSIDFHLQRKGAMLDALRVISSLI